MLSHYDGHSTNDQISSVSFNSNEIVIKHFSNFSWIYFWNYHTQCLKTILKHHSSAVSKTYWPRTEELELTMPLQFRQHFNRKCISIIDCFEVFIEQPSNLEARMETWTSYKHHNTVQFLAGIIPQETVSFISKAWGEE